MGEEAITRRLQEPTPDLSTPMFTLEESRQNKADIYKMDGEIWSDTAKDTLVSTMNQFENGEPLSPIQAYVYLSATTFETTANILAQQHFLENSDSSLAYEDIKRCGNLKVFLDESVARITPKDPYQRGEYTNPWKATFADLGFAFDQRHLGNFERILKNQIEDLKTQNTNLETVVEKGGLTLSQEEIMKRKNIRNHVIVSLRETIDLISKVTSKNE